MRVAATNHAVLFLLVAAALSGCAADDGSPSAATPDLAAADFDATTGAVTGYAIDEQGLPITGAQIGLQGTNATTRTLDDGRFALNNVPPGTYTLLAAKIGYEPAARQVTVEADRETSGVQVVLTATAILEPYHQTQTFDGLVECAWGVSGLSGNCVPLQFLFQQIGTNPTATRIIGLYRFDDPGNVTQGIFEMTWTPTGALFSDAMLLTVEQELTGVINGATYNRSQGASPVRVVVGSEPFAALDLDDPDNDQVQTRTFPAMEIPPTFVVQQRFTVFATACWHETCPATFTALPEE